MKYNCDICNSEGDQYFGYNSTYGYCDNPKCKEKANGRITKTLYEMMGMEDTTLSDLEDLIGDQDII